MIDDSQLSFSLPSVSRKKATAVFDGGRRSSDRGVMLLALVERRRNVAATLAALIADRRDPSHIRHTVADMLRARMLVIGCGSRWQRLRLVAPRPRFHAGARAAGAKPSAPPLDETTAPSPPTTPREH